VYLGRAGPGQPVDAVVTEVRAVSIDERGVRGEDEVGLERLRQKGLEVVRVFGRPTGRPVRRASACRAAAPATSDQSLVASTKSDSAGVSAKRTHGAKKRLSSAPSMK
jgi:hypothetical protein